MQIMAIYWKGVWEGSIGRDGSRFAGHTAAERACFDRRIATMRTRRSLFAA